MRSLPILAGILAVISASVGCSPAPVQAPQLTGAGTRYTLQLPAEMQAALDAYAPGFRPAGVEQYHSDYVRGYQFSNRQAMFAVIGDFNGDQRLDVAIQGRRQARSMALVVLSDGNGYRVVEFPGAAGYAGPPGSSDVYLEYTPPGRIESPICDSSCVLDLRTDAFSVTYDDKAGEVWYYLNGKFHRFATGD